MLNIKVTSEAAARLRAIVDEEGKDAVVRVRETKCGAGCKSAIVLRLSIDEREDEDVEGEAEALSFVIAQDLVDTYGNNFFVSLDENQVPTVVVQN